MYLPGFAVVILQSFLFIASVFCDPHSLVFNKKRIPNLGIKTDEALTSLLTIF